MAQLHAWTLNSEENEMRQDLRRIDGLLRVDLAGPGAWDQG